MKSSLFKPSTLKDLGVLDWGYTNSDEAKSYYIYEKWIEKGHHGPLAYLTGEKKDKRKKISDYYPEFKSALVFLFSYQKEKKMLDRFYQSSESNGLKIGSYVFGFGGKDYHKVLREKLETLASYLPEGISYKLSLDTQPILERDLAYRAGLGWFGKNSMFINKKEGSFFIIGSLLLNDTLDLPVQSEDTDHCGQCTKCIDLCPTDAIEDRIIISQKCISTYTIEVFKEGTPPQGYPNSGGEIFGCDICQDVCPWNIKALSKINEETTLNPQIQDFFLKTPVDEILKKLKEMTNRGFRKVFKDTPLERTGRLGLLKNIKLFK